MKNKIKTFEELLKEVNHTSLKSVSGGVYVGVALGIALSMFNIYRYTDVDPLLFVWLIGLGVIGLIYGIGLIITSGVQFRIK